MEFKRNNVERIDINKVILSDIVLKENDHQLNEKLRLSIVARGQLKNIVVCEDGNGNYECLEGSKIVKILRDLKQDTVNAVNLGILSNEEKDLVRIEISRDYFLTNYVCIGELIKGLKQTMRIETICNTLPYTVRQSENLIKMTEFDWDDFNQNKQIEGQVSMFDFEDVFENFIPHQPHTEEEMTSEVTHELDEIADEQKELQPWQETVLEMTKDEPAVEIADEIHVPVNVEPEEQTEESSFSEPIDFEVAHEQQPEEQEPVEIEFTPVVEEQEELNTEPIPEPVNEEEDEIQIHNEYTNYYLNENDELVVLKHKEMVIEALPQIAVNYIIKKYGQQVILKKELKMHEIDGVAYVSAVVLITQYGVVYRLKPSHIIETLMEFVDIVDSSDQPTLF